MLQPERLRNILVIRTDRIGDAVLSTPVVENLRLYAPHSNIVFLCAPAGYDIVAANPFLNEVIVYDKKKHPSFSATMQFGLRLRKKKFDLVVVLHPTNRAHLLAFLSGARVRIGWNRKCGFLLTKSFFHEKHLGLYHERDYTLMLLSRAGIPVQTERLFVPVYPEAEKWADNFFRKHQISSPVVLGIGASCFSKLWPVQNFIELCQMVQAQLNRQIILIGSTDDSESAGTICAGFAGSVINLCGQTNLRQAISLLNRASIFIGNDSGLGHIAGAFGTPVITLFGRKQPGLSPKRWKVLGDRAYYFHKDSGCAVCRAHECVNDFLCIRSITPREVFSKAKEIL